MLRSGYVSARVKNVVVILLNVWGTVMVEMLIVGSTGLGYAIVGTLQGLKGEYSNMMIWLGYAFAQIGLFLNLK